MSILMERGGDSRPTGRKPRILVVGEPFTDIYHLASTTRISPEAPVPVFKVQEELQLPGGAANVAENLRQLGADVSTAFPPGPRPCKNRLMVGDTQVARWDQQDTFEPYTGLLFGPGVSYYDAIIFSDYGKGAFTPAVKKGLVRGLQIYTGHVFVDTKSSPKEWDPAFTFFPNTTEYEAHKTDYQNTPYVVRTLGAEGMEFLYYGAQKAHCPARAQSPRSVIGAGDTVIAAFAYGVLEGNSLDGALQFASDCAAAKVRKPYTL